MISTPETAYKPHGHKTHKNYSLCGALTQITRILDSLGMKYFRADEPSPHNVESRQ